MEWLTILGLAAALCTTTAFAPQAWKVLKTRRTEDLSLEMYIIFTLGITLWLIYGILIKDIPIIVANVITFLFAITILILKLKYK